MNFNLLNLKLIIPEYYKESYKNHIFSQISMKWKGMGFERYYRITKQYFITPFGSEKVKEEEEQLNDDNSEHVVIDEFKSILKDDDDYTKSPKKITDPDEIKENIFVILQKYIESSKGDLMQFELKDSKLKFEVLRDCTMIIGKKIPNFELNKINTVKDAIDFFTQEEESDQRKGHPVAEWFIKHKDELPSNMMFIPYVKERGVNREDRSKRQKFKIKEHN
ncbi:unnamed protein product [Rhizophagus irregularis]|nr:unnamed protein product [Rhizophagus irregularis]